MASKSKKEIRTLKEGISTFENEVGETQRMTSKCRELMTGIVGKEEITLDDLKEYLSLAECERELLNRQGNLGRKILDLGDQVERRKNSEFWDNLNRVETAEVKEVIPEKEGEPE